MTSCRRKFQRLHDGIRPWRCGTRWSSKLPNTYEHNVDRFTYIHKMTTRSALRPWNNQYSLQWSHLCHVLSQHIAISWDINFPPQDIKLQVNMGTDNPFTPTPTCNISWVLHTCFPLWMGLTPLPVYVTASLNADPSQPLGEHIWARAGEAPGEDSHRHGGILRFR